MNEIKVMREKHNLTQMALAKKIGVSINSVAKWENDVATPSEDNQEKLNLLFNTLERGD